MDLDPLALRRLDMNLLVILDVLLEERHVTRAAARLALTQSATSSALERMRQHLGDPLLVRVGSGMRLTPLAERMREPLRALITSTHELLRTTRGFDPAQVRQTVRVGMRDYASVVLLPGLMKLLAQQAPGLELVVMPIVGGDESQGSLDSAALDLAVTVFPRLAPHLHRQRLFADPVVCLMRRGHPAAVQRLTARRLAQYPGVLISGRGQPAGVSDQVLAARGLPRRITLSVPHYLVVPAVLRETDAIALVPAWLASHHAPHMVTRPVPFELPPLVMEMAWHPRTHDDALGQWLRGQMLKVASRAMGKVAP